MKVSRERLQIIGKMIGILREEKRQNKQNSWTQIRFCENICSPNTLKSIESGKVGRSDAIYEQLLAKLDLKYGEFPVIDEGIEKLVEDLHKAIEFYNIEEIKNLTIKGMKVLENAKEYIWYSSIYHVINSVYHYYIDDVLISENMADCYIKLLPIFDDKLKDIMKVLSFAAIKGICICDLDLYKKYVYLLDLENSGLACLKVNLMHYFYKINEQMKTIEICKYLEQRFTEEQNYIRLLDTYNGAISLMGYLDKNMVEEYISKAMHILETEKISIDKKSDTYTNIGDSFHRRKDYDKALYFLSKAVEKGCSFLISNYLLIADCQNHLELKIDIPDIDKKQKMKYPKELRVMFNYFQMYNEEEVPPLLKQKMLMKHIAPLLQDDATIEIFDYELKKLVKVTNSYKDLLKFDEIIKKNINSL